MGGVQKALTIKKEKRIVNRFQRYLTILFVCLFAAAASADELSNQQKTELMVFGMKAMGLNVGMADVKKVLSIPEIEHMVATGLNLNGFLCAKVVNIHQLKIDSTYECRCIAYRNGTAEKTYIIDALKGTAFEP